MPLQGRERYPNRLRYPTPGVFHRLALDERVRIGHFEIERNDAGHPRTRMTPLTSHGREDPCRYR
jgi:hypothetical protein